MHEKDIINELRRASRDLLPIEGLKIDVPSKIASDRLGNIDLVARLDFRGLSFDVIFAIVSSSSLPYCKTKSPC